MNLGDIAIAESMISQMQEIFPGAEIILEASHPEYSRKYFKNIEIIPRLFDVFQVTHTKRVYSLEFFAKNILVFLNMFYAFTYSYLFVLFKFRDSRIQILNYYRKADLILAAGGDYLSPIYGFGYLLRFYEFSLIKRFKKPLILYAQSIGPFKGFSAKIAEKYLSLVDAILARDEKTVDLLNLYKINTKIYRTADSASLLLKKYSPLVRKMVNEYKLDNKTIGICLRDIKYTEISEKKYSDYINESLKLIDHIRRMDYKVVFISANDADYSLFEKLNQENYFDINVLLATDYTPGEFKEILSRLGVVISSRMHPIILASTAGVLVIGIGKEFKMKNYLKSIGLEKYYFDMNDVDAIKISNLLKEILRNDSFLRNDMLLRVHKLESEARKNMIYTKDIYYSLLENRNSTTNSKLQKSINIYNE